MTVSTKMYRIILKTGQLPLELGVLKNVQSYMLETLFEHYRNVLPNYSIKQGKAPCCHCFLTT